VKINEFQTLIFALGELYDKELSVNLVNIYYEVFKDFDVKIFNNAIKEIIINRKYSTFPKPAEILEYLQDTKDDVAMIAWLKVRGAIENVGHTETVEFDDPVISHCLFQMGGWQKVCEILNKDLPFMEREFMELYRFYAKRGIKLPVKLAGFFETTNRANGFINNIPKPVKIGFVNSELLVERNKNVNK